MPGLLLPYVRLEKVDFRLASYRECFATQRIRRMNLFLAGLDHTTAPVEIREQLAFSQTDLPSALIRLTVSETGAPPLFSEAVILSTCNRVELYGVTNPGTTTQHVVK